MSVCRISLNFVFLYIDYDFLKYDFSMLISDSLSAWRNFTFLAIENAPREDSDWTARIFTERSSKGAFPDNAADM